MRSVKQLLKIIDSAEKELFESFKFEPHWHDYKINDRTDEPWAIIGRSVFWTTKPCFSASMIEEGSVIFSGVLMSDEKWHSNGHTALLEDTLTDGNRYISIFTDSKQLKNAVLLEALCDHWG